MVVYTYNKLYRFFINIVGPVPANIEAGNIYPWA